MRGHVNAASRLARLRRQPGGHRRDRLRDVATRHDQRLRSQLSDEETARLAELLDKLQAGLEAPDRRVGRYAPASMAGESPGRWHGLDLEAVARGLETSLQTGLSGDEAVRRLTRFGPNELEAGEGTSPWSLLLDQLKNVLILILLVAVALSAVLGHATEAVVITVIVLFAVLLGFVQEYRAERAIEALREMAAPTATVLRDGETVQIPAREVVPGDVLLLAAGDRAPADGRVIEVVNLQVEEAALTGESLPVEKQTDVIAETISPSATAATWSTPARPSPTAAAAPSWSLPACARSSAASPGCSRRSSGARRRCS